MSHNHGTGYTLGFSVAVCLVCSVFVCLSAVMLKERQEENARVDKQKNVLIAAGLAKGDEKLTNAEIVKRFESIKPLVVELKTGKVNETVDPAGFDMIAAMADPALSSAAPANGAKVMRVPNNVIIYQVLEGDKATKLVIPIQGKGLWSTMYGFLAIDADTTTVKGVSFYKHGETPGLGGEIENPRWLAGWLEKKVFDASWKPAFKVKKGIVNSSIEVEKNHYVDGMSGATLTGNGVTATVNFWIGDSGYGPYLKNFREGGQ